MNKAAIIALVLLLAVLSTAIHEIPMKHRKRTEREGKIFIDYMTRGPLVQKVNKLLSKIFPSPMTPNIYAYPEVKIINYLDAQYYGYNIYHIDKLISELPLKPSELSSILDLPTFGFLQKSADYPLPAISTDTTTLLKVQPTSTMALISISHMDLEP